jgi:hypothetical protein
MNAVKKSAEKSEIKIILSKQWHLLSIKRGANFCVHIPIIHMQKEEI